MNRKSINRIDYKNTAMDLDFEIVDIQLFFASRSHNALTKDFRLNFWSILYIIEGNGHHYIDFKKYNYKGGDIIICHKNQVHHYEINPDTKGYIIHINEPFFFKMKGFSSEIFLEFTDTLYDLPVLSTDPRSSQTSRILIDLIYKEYHMSDAFFNADLISSLFQGFILSIKSQVVQPMTIASSTDFEHFRNFRRLIEKRYTTIKAVDEYAQLMHLSTKTLNKVTRNVVGLSAKQYIINRVLLEIKRYLSQGDLLNYEISELLGFDEAANMTRFFTHYEGISPKAFKQKMDS